MDSISEAWNFIFKHFYCKRTNLIYDYRVSRYFSAAHCLPKPEQIRRQIPNPCGWGTGMEDSVLNNGSALDAVVAEYNATKNEALAGVAAGLFNGLLRCADVADVRGFIARSVSPDDRLSHYCNSSRDQYTLWVYSAVRFYGSRLCNETQKADIRRVLTDIAKKCEHDVVEANDYNILREDGGIGLACCMWRNINPHEYLRLPMLYAAAFYVTGDTHWFKMCMKYRDEALARTAPYNVNTNRCYATLQLQYSLRLMYDIIDDENFKAGCLKIMSRLAEYGEQYAIENGRLLCRLDFNTDFDYRYKPWNKVEMLDMGEFGGYHYHNPAQSEKSENKAFYPLRSVGEAASIAALCPNRRVNAGLIFVLQTLASSIDYRNHYTYAPLLVACGYKLCLENISNTASKR